MRNIFVMLFLMIQVMALLGCSTNKPVENKVTKEVVKISFKEIKNTISSSTSTPKKIIDDKNKMNEFVTAFKDKKPIIASPDEKPNYSISIEYEDKSYKELFLWIDLSSSEIAKLQDITEKGDNYSLSKKSSDIIRKLIR